MQKFKKPLTVIAIVMGALLLGAVVMGVLNALVADGAWHFGWESYRYEDSGYEIGGASVPSRTSLKPNSPAFRPLPSSTFLAFTEM